MKVLLFAVLGLAAVIGLSLYQTKGGKPSSEEVVDTLRAIDVRMADAEVSLEGCQLSMHIRDNSSESGKTQLGYQETDLRLFDLQKGSVRALGEHGVQLIIGRKKISDALLDQVQQVIQLFPVDSAVEPTHPVILRQQKQPAESETAKPGAASRMTRKQIVDMLARPDSSISFSWMTLSGLKNPAQREPIADATNFHRSAVAVLKLPSPRTYTLVLIYNGDVPTPENLVAASLTTPSILQFVAPTQEFAQDLGRVLFKYGADNCES